MGVVMALGLLDAGGRNVVVSLNTRSGFPRMAAAIGMLMWQQYWYWFPLTHFISLAFTPSALVGLDGELNIPAGFTPMCMAKPSQFAYQRKLSDKREKKESEVVTAVLSTTAKAKAREARKEAKRRLLAELNGGAVPLDRMSSFGTVTTVTAGEEEKREEEKKKKVRVPEPLTFSLSNPSRVTPTQEAYVRISEGDDDRFVPVMKNAPRSGILVLADRRPGEAADVKKVDLRSIGQEEEAPAPEPFEWTPEA